MAIARGEMMKEACGVCQRRGDVIAYIADPARWSDVVWTCREHRNGAVELRRQLTSQRPTWLDQREAALTAIADLSKEVRELLYEIASCGPAGVLLSHESPLFIMRLVRAYELQSARAALDGGS